ncbi:hypothetical protein Tco_1413060 [Tanacetum coccineum]
MVAYLEKSTENADFDEIVDFLNANPIRYALTTIVISESSVRRDLQFNDEDGIACLTNTEIFENLQLMMWVKVQDNPLNPNTHLLLLHHLILNQSILLRHHHNPKRPTNVRKPKGPTEISQSSGPTTLVADETVHEERGDSMERAATTAASLDAE